MIDKEKVWEGALGQIETEVSKANFLTWFKNTDIVKYDSDTIYVGVPNTFVRDWICSKYHKTILKALRSDVASVRSVEYVVSKDKPKEGKKKVEQKTPGVNNQLEIQEVYINKEDGLNTKYDFESFVVGPFNELAFAAAQAVIKNPGLNYNPLFIYGGTGLGKTHLIQSIGNYFKKIDSNKKVYYLTSEKFTVECIDAIRNNKGNIFKEKYRKYDILILDDVQFLSGKEHTQEELFHLFNALYDQNKQIVFSSDKPPKQIPDLEERLKSRFEGGMMADISNPDYESRLAILSTKMNNNGISLPAELAEYVASVVQNNIRELEGVYNSIACQTELKKRNLTMNEIKTLIKHSIKPPKSITANDVIKTIADYYNVEEQSLYEKTRKKEVVKPRQIVMYLLREYFSASYPFIGQKMGGRDHTTCIHAYEKIKRDLVSDNVLSQEIDQIKSLLYNEV